jgi:hypothetical protein
MLPDAKAKDIEQYHAHIYEANREAAFVYFPERAVTWSATYTAELDRTNHFTGSHYFTESKKPISEDCGRAFADSVMDTIRAYPWGQHAYWFLQIRGIKDLTRYVGPIPDRVVNLVLKSVVRSESVIFMDLGLEVHPPAGFSSMPSRVSKCHEGVARVVWGISPDDWDYSLYDVDIWAGVGDIAGFRCNFSEAPRTENLISYIQVYSTDKFQMFNASSKGSKSVRLTTKEALHMVHPDVTPNSIPKVYQATADDQLAHTPTVTRFEARVPLHCARAAYNPTLTVADFAPFIHVVPATVIWCVLVIQDCFICLI